MTATLDEDTAMTGAVVPYAGAAGAVEEYRPRMLMAPGEAREIDQALRDMMKAVLHENVDYGVIPGTNKPSLYKPGAEKLLQWFGFGHSMERVEIERGPNGERVGVTYRCTVTKAMPDGRVIIVATCEGYAGYDEERFYTSAEQAEAKERAMAERYKRSVNQSKCVEYRAPWNSVIKMCQKRALVGAALQATSGSTLFTQDVEDSTAPEAAPAASVASAASEVVASLPEEARRGVDKWRREQGWPAPGDWDASQWCAALVQAGRLDERAVFAKAGVELTEKQPAEDAWTAHPDPDEWVNEHIELAATFPDAEAGRMLYRKIVAKQKAGEITEDQRKNLCDLITARVDDLNKEAAPVEGNVAAPDGDPWQAAIDSMTTREDALPLLDELETARDKQTIDGRRYKALKVAIRNKAESLPSAPGEAA